MFRLLQALALLAAPACISAITFNCEGESDKGHTLILKELGGPKAIHVQESTGLSVHNTTWTIDVCNPLKQDSSIPSEEQCEHGTRVCGVKRLWHNNTYEPEEVLNIAGEYTLTEGHGLEPEVRWIGGGASHEDAEREGFRVTFNGGRVPFTSRQGVRQQAIIEFLCSEKTGLEGFENDAILVKRDDGDEEPEEPELPDLDKDKALSFVSYKSRDEVMILRLKWETKYACAESKGGDDAPARSGSHWGFFTWFIIVVFLLAAAYIIFGSWLNYNRYGARGWDLVPHGDTIRDLPYILKDLFSNLMSRIRGGGSSRGGYAAV